MHLFRGNCPFSGAFGTPREDYSSSELKRFFKKEIGVAKEVAVRALKPKERKEGKRDERGKMMVRVIELDSDHSFRFARFHRRTMGSVKIEEYEVG